MIRVLIADDDRTTLAMVEAFCRDEDGLELVFAADGQQALAHIQAGRCDILVSDVQMPVLAGDELLDAVKQAFAHIPVIIMTGYGSVEGAVDFVQRGACDYLLKPLTKAAFLDRLHRVMKPVVLARKLREQKDAAGGSPIDNLLGRSAQMVALKAKLPSLAQTDASVVIYGESGTGKEVVARTIHQLSRRADKPFVTVNCGALPEALLEAELFGYRRGAFTDAHADNPGLVDASDTGTLFLDEIGEISLSVQVKLLRFLEFKEYKPVGSPKSRIADVRIVAATNRNLLQAVEERTFREDLYYRLNVVPLHLPPLRERGDDVALLAQSFLDRFNHRFGKSVRLTPEGYRKLQSYSWPGNIRELENKVGQIVVMATNGALCPEDIDVGPTAPSTPSTPPPTFTVRSVGRFQDEKQALLRRFEHDYVTALLEEEHGHVTKAAKRAGLDRKNLWQLMKRHNLRAETFKKDA